jgi:hypothetical protein
MVELSEVEDRLASMFQAVARQVPEEPVTGPAPLTTLQLRPGGGAGPAAPAPCGGGALPEGTSPVGSPRPARWRRRGAAAGVVAATLAIGTGAAAATGWLSPSAVRHNVGVAMGPAGSIVGSEDPGAVPGAVLRVSMAGPDGAVLNVTSDSGRAGDLAAATCVTLTVTTASGGPVPWASLADKGGCGMVVAESLGHPIAPAPLGAGQTRSTWLAPSGQGYDIFFGGPEPGATSVVLTNGRGKPGAAGKVVDGWYVIYIGTGRAGAFDNLTFLNAGGKVVASSRW